MPYASGRTTKGYIAADDFQTAQAVTLYDVATQEVVTIDVNQIFVIYLISVSNGDTDAVITVFDDADGDGNVDTAEILFKKSMASKEQAGYAWVRGMGVKRAPKIKASAASANSFVLILGEVQGQ